MSLCPKYPNLELLEYIFCDALLNDEKWRAKRENIKKAGRSARLEFDATVFSQEWGGTNTAFDVMPDGSAAWGGAAITRAYTVVIQERTTDVYGVFVDDKPAYMVYNASEAFYEDLNARNMKSLSQAKKLY